jgi:hypothetical protein
VLLALASTACASWAWASAFEVLGFGPEGVAEVSARAARVRDGTAAFYNPGGLAFGSGYGLRLAGTGAFSMLDAQSARQAIADPVGASIASDLDVPLEGPLHGKIRVGLGLYALPNKLLRLRTRETTAPFFPYYDNRTQRLTAIPALAVRPIEPLGVGVGLNLLGGVAGPVDVREGQSRALESRLEQEVATVASLVAGAQLEATRRLRFGLAYRQRFGIPLRITTTANVAGVPLAVNVTATDALFDPSVVVLAASFEPAEGLGFELDASWHHWSSWSGPLLEVEATVSALALSSHPPQGLFQDAWAGRAAGWWRVSRTATREIDVHAGAGLESSMLRSDVQQGRSNMVDGAKLLLGAGASVAFEGLVGRRLRLGLGVQAQRVSPFSQAKVACTRVPCPPDTVVGPDTANPTQGITNPGYPALTSGGVLFVGSVGVGVEL